MDLSLTESEEILKKAARDFMQEETPKGVLLQLDNTSTGYTSKIWDKVVEMGWLGVIIPERYGGVESSLTSAGILFEELGRGPLPGPYFSSGILGSLIIMEAGTEEQKRSILPAIPQGKQVLSLALTESDYGWGPSSVQLNATSENKGFTINGSKLFVLDAEAATHFICVARTKKRDDPEDGISLFLIDKKSPGLMVRNLPGWLKWCYEVRFDSVMIPSSTLIGEKDKGWQLLQQAIMKATPVICAYMVGGCQSLVERTIEYSKTRVQFSNPIGHFQRVQDLILKMVDCTDAARWTTYESLWKLDAAKPADESVHVAKAVSSEAYYQASTLSHWAHGGIGLDIEQGLYLHSRMSRFLYSYIGDPSFHRRKLARLLRYGDL